MEQVVILNADYSFIGMVSIRKAMRLLEKGKAEVLSAYDTVLRTVSRTFSVPRVLRLIKLVRIIYKKAVSLSPRNLFIRDDFTCQYCGKKTRQLEMEHVVPKSHGGKRVWENMVAACTPCNRRKADRLPAEAGMYLRTRPYQPSVMEFFLKMVKNLKVDELLKELGVW